MPARRATLLLLLLCACEAVPDIRFVGEDAGAPSHPGSDAGPTTDNDASPSGCSEPKPDGATQCCNGTIWCFGICTESNCGLCVQNCAAGLYCCGKPGNALCKDKC